jgi:hypothetical protein
MELFCDVQDVAQHGAASRSIGWAIDLEPAPAASVSGRRHEAAALTGQTLTVDPAS